jgi:heme/copper-type cytochrome/quinol oxidase subunit 2
MRRIVILLVIAFFLMACAPPETFDEPLAHLDSAEDIQDPFGDAPLKIFAVRAYRFQFDPNEIIVDEGDHVRITITSLDVGHGFALPDFGINQKIPPEDSVTIDFLADKPGEFGFFSSVYSGSGYKNMTGTFTVRARAVSPAANDLSE